MARRNYGGLDGPSTRGGTGDAAMTRHVHLPIHGSGHASRRFIDSHDAVWGDDGCDAGGHSARVTPELRLRTASIPLTATSAAC